MMPDDAFHVRRLTDAGVTIVRGTARLDGPGRVTVQHEDVVHELEAGDVVVAVGSESRVPDLPVAVLALSGGECQSRDYDCD